MASTFNLFALCVLIWGSTWLVITYQLGSVAPEMSVAWRFAVASALLFAWCWQRGITLRFRVQQHLDFAALGAGMFCISYIFVYYAETYIVSGMVAVAYSASPMLNMLGARLFFQTPMTLRVTVASLLGVVGIVCVFWPEFGHLSASRNTELGTLFTVLSVLASAAGSLLATRSHRQGYNRWASMAWAMAYGALLALLIGLALGQRISFVWTTPYIGSLLYLALLGSIVTFGCYLTLIARIGAARAAYVGVMVPIVALVVSTFFEGFQWAVLTVVGVLLSVAGNVIMLTGKKEH